MPSTIHWMHRLLMRSSNKAFPTPSRLDNSWINSPHHTGWDGHDAASNPITTYISPAGIARTRASPLLGRLPTPRPCRMNQSELQRQLQLLLNDQRQIATEHRIVDITTTNTITTTYKDGNRPTVFRISTRVSYEDGGVDIERIIFKDNLRTWFVEPIGWFACVLSSSMVVVPSYDVLPFQAVPCIL